MLDSSPHPQHWPLPLGRYGTNPYGDPLYRIVFAPSRKKLVCGTWRDGSNQAKFKPAYPQVKDQWIMERWTTAEKFAGCSRKTWEMTLLVNGPWPERGDYQLCHVFEACTPTDANIEKLVSWIEAGQYASAQENLDACKSDYDNEQMAARKTGLDRVRDAIPAFLDAPISARGGNRGTKTSDFRFGPPRAMPNPGGIKTGRPQKVELCQR